jgi:hypothetical protein
VLLTGEPLDPELAMTAGACRVDENVACRTGCAVIAFAYRAGSSFLVLIHSRLPLTWIRGVREKLGNDDVLGICQTPVYFSYLKAHRISMNEGIVAFGSAFTFYRSRAAHVYTMCFDQGQTHALRESGKPATETSFLPEHMFRNLLLSAMCIDKARPFTMKL